MKLTTTKEIVTVDCEHSSSLTSLAIIDDIIVVASYKSNPTVKYVYTMPTPGSLAKLVSFDSAGKFVASFVKPLASFVTKTTDSGTVVLHADNLV